MIHKGIEIIIVQKYLFLNIFTSPLYIHVFFITCIYIKNFNKVLYSINFLRAFVVP